MVKNTDKTKNLPQIVETRRSKDVVALSQSKGKGLFIVSRGGKK